MPPEKGQCFVAHEIAPSANPGQIEDYNKVRFRVELVLSFDFDDGIEAEGTLL